jgi:hypothetical protein
MRLQEMGSWTLMAWKGFVASASSPADSLDNHYFGFAGNNSSPTLTIFLNRKIFVGLSRFLDRIISALAKE